MNSTTGAKIARHFDLTGEFFAGLNKAHTLDTCGLFRMLQTIAKTGRKKPVRIVIDYDPDFEYFAYRVMERR